MQPIKILVTLDRNYLDPLRILLKSLFVSNPAARFEVHMIHSDLSPEELSALAACCGRNGSSLHPVATDPAQFADAPVFRHYTRAMYYRLFACHMLPQDVGRVLYLDPDTLVINPIASLWETDLKGNLFAAAMHTGLTSFTENVNRIRLRTSGLYFNSGVMLMDLERAREAVRPDDVYAYVKEHAKELILPDQDILNALYGDRILPLDDSLYNYDARSYRTYLLTSGGRKDTDWVMRNTSILHFCGTRKPWQAQYPYRFGILYKHYMQLERLDRLASAEGAPQC